MSKPTTLEKLGLQKDTTGTGTFHPSVKQRLAKNINKNGPISEYAPSLGCCWIWTGVINQEGYGTVYVKTSEGRNRRGPAHRIVYSIHIGCDIPNGIIVRHLCHNKLCVRPGHLAIGTDADNAMDGAKKKKRDAELGKAPTKKKSFPKAKTLEEGFWLRVNKTDRCYEWIGTLKSGYGQFSVEQGKWTPAHRWIYEHTYGKIPEGLFIMHLCDNPKCVRPEHLKPGTHADNMRDMCEKDRHGSTKLGHCEVNELRDEYEKGTPYKDIVEKFDISNASIVRIVSGETYGCLGLSEIDRDRRRKLTMDEAKEVHRLWHLHTIEELSDMFGLSEWGINDIIEGRNWKELNIPPPTQEERTTRTERLFGIKRLTWDVIDSVKKLLIERNQTEVSDILNISKGTISRIAIGYVPNYLKKQPPKK